MKALRRCARALPALGAVVIAAALLAPTATSDAGAAESHLDAACESGPVADETSTTGPVAHVGGGVLASASAAARTLRAETSAHGDRTGPEHRYCSVLTRFANGLTVGAGTSGKSDGDPVSLVVTVRLHGSLGVGYHGPLAPPDQRPYHASSELAAQFRLTDPGRPECEPEDGVVVCRPAQLVSYDAQARRHESGARGWSGDPDGAVTRSTRWSWQLATATERLGNEDETYAEICSAWPADLPCGAADPFPGPPLPDVVGTRSIAVETFVGSRLELQGLLSVLPQATQDGHASAAFHDPGDGLAVDITPAPGFEGLDLAYDLGLPAATLAVSDATVAESDAGRTRAAFTVTLSAARAQPVTVAFATADGTATAGDYDPVAGTLTFAPGEREKELAVDVLGDVTPEADEIFHLDLSDADGAVIADGRGVGTIEDDDGDPATISIEDATVTEGTGGARLAELEVVLSRPVAEGVPFQFATSDGTATQPADYTRVDASFAVPGNETRTVVRIPIATDGEMEGEEAFSVELTFAVGAAIERGRATVTIVDDDGCLDVIRFAFVEAKGCFVRAGDEYLAVGGLKVNGLDVAPSGPSTEIRIDPTVRRIHTGGGDVRVSAGHLHLPPASIDWVLEPSSGSGEESVWYWLVTPADFVYLKGLAVTGLVNLRFTADRKAKLAVPVGIPLLPAVKIEDVWLKGEARLLTDNERGLFSDSVRVVAENLPVPPVLVKELAIGWDELRQRWDGAATVVVPTPEKLELSAGFAFQSGRFAGATGAVENLNAPVGGGVYVQAIRFAVAFEPLELGGGIGVSAGPLVAGKSALRVDGDFSIRFGDPLALGLSGRVRLVDFGLANAYFRYFSSGSIEFGGGLAVGLPEDAAPETQPVRVVAGIDGWVDGTRAFSAHAEAFVDVLGLKLVGAELLVSSVGLAACGQVTWLDVGFGYRWETRELALMGPWACGVGDYEPAWPAPAGISRATAAAAPERLELPAADRGLVLKLHGDTGAPKVRLAGPGGRSVETPADGTPLANDEFVVLQDELGSTTIVAIRRPQGEWTVTELPGSADVESVEQAAVLPPPSVAAELRGRGDGQTLSWRLTPRSGQLVTFVEEGEEVARVLERTNDAAGTLTFEHSAGPGGRREVVAVVEQDGMPRDRIVVASFTAPERSADLKPVLRDLRELETDVARSDVAAAVREELRNPLLAARKELRARRPDVAAACGLLRDFRRLVERHVGPQGRIPAATADRWVVAAETIRLRLPCA